MVWMKRTRRVLRGRRLWPFLDTLMNYERNPNHSINEHVDHVVNMIKSLEVEYIFQSGYKKRILQMLLTESKTKVLENIWEFVQEGPHGFTNNSFDDLVALFKEHWQICFVKNVIRWITTVYISPNLLSASFSNSIKHKIFRGL